MFKKLIPLAVAGMAVLALAGCGPTSGTIHDKAHTAGYYSTYYQCYAYNKDGACTMNIPVQQYNEPTWSFDLYASDDDHGWHGVSEETYNRYEVGDYYGEEEEK